MAIQQDHAGRFWDDSDMNPADDDITWLEPTTCHHGQVMADCEKCDEEIEARGGLDKCLNCGRYKYGDQLNKDQVCIKPCRNPNEDSEIPSLPESSGGRLAEAIACGDEEK